MNKIILNNRIDFLLLISKIYETRRSFYQLFLLGFIIISIIYLFSDRIYRSDALLTNLASSNTPDIVSSALTGSMGLTSTIDIDPTVIFSSESLKKSIIYKKRKSEKFNKEINLIEYWELDKSLWYNPMFWIQSFLSLFSEEKNEEVEKRMLEKKAIDLLSERISINEDFYTNAITISVEMEERILAQNINSEIISFINQFLVEAKNQNASAEIYYLDERLNEVRNSLEISENNLQIFKEENSNYLKSPQLFKEFSRINRQVLLNTEIFIQLQSQIEIKKLEEVSEVSSFILIDNPSFPHKKIWPKLSYLILFLVIFTFLLSVIIVLIKDLFYEN